MTINVTIRKKTKRAVMDIGGNRIASFGVGLEASDKYGQTYSFEVPFDLFNSIEIGDKLDLIIPTI